MNQTTKWAIIVICLMLIWGSIFLLFYLKADEVTKDPCSICSKRMGKDVLCTQINTKSSNPATRIYYPNGSKFDNIIEDTSLPYINLTINFNGT